jgi:RNA polymerase-binding transcription factor DksA
MNTDTYKQKLEVEKAKLESNMTDVGRRNPKVPNDWEPAPIQANAESDLADQADLINDRETKAAILNDLEARYDNILRALERVEHNTYGTCEVCGKTIETARLDADPAAMTCIEHI